MKKLCFIQVFVRCLSSGGVRSFQRPTFQKQEAFSFENHRSSAGQGKTHIRSLVLVDWFGLFILWYLIDKEIFFLLLSLLFLHEQKKALFHYNPKVIFYSKNPSQGKENKAQQCLSLLTPADTDTSLTSGRNHTWSSLHEHTFLYLLRLISRLVSRWSYATDLKNVIKSLQPRPRDCVFPIDPPVSAALTWIGVW